MDLKKVVHKIKYLRIKEVSSAQKRLFECEQALNKARHELEQAQRKVELIGECDINHITEDDISDL